MFRQLVAFFCLLHVCTIFWWALPNSFGSPVASENQKNIVLSNALHLLKLYIDFTGSQQYWDFFAPHSAKYHQYLSVCSDIQTFPQQEIIACKGKPLFSNLGNNFEHFEAFGSDRSRLYRLTENLAKLEDDSLRAAFTDYYRDQQISNDTPQNNQAILVLHQFELHPELKDLPTSGYRSDKILWARD